MLRHDFEGSSNVVAAMHDGADQLIVVFAKAGAYRYDGVPIKTFEDLKAAESPGKFVHANLRDHFPTKKVEL